MCGGIIKCHFFETAARAALIRKEFPDLEVFGGIALNKSVGGINPAAVEKTAKMGSDHLVSNYGCPGLPDL